MIRPIRLGMEAEAAARTLPTAQERWEAAKLPLLVAGLTGLAWLYALDVLDPPATYSCQGPAPPSAAEERADYLLLALPPVVVYWGWLIAAGWRSAAARLRSARKSRRLASTLVLGTGGVLALLWAPVLIMAFDAERTGGALLYSLLLMVAGAVVIGVIAFLLIAQLVLVRGPLERWRGTVQLLNAALIWATALFALPSLLVFIAIAGTDTTIWC